MPKKILVADNDDLLRSLVREALEEAGYEVSAVGDGLDAWRRLQVERPDYLILDLVMPRLDGIRLCEYLKMDPRFQALPIFVLTGAAAEAGSQLEALGAEACIAKRAAREMVGDLLDAIRTFERGEGGSPAGRFPGVQESAPRQIVIELLAETAHLTAILQNLGEGVLLLDPAEQILYANPAAAEIFRQPAGRLLGTPLAGLWDEAAANSLRRGLQRLRAQGAASAIRLQAARGDRTFQLTITNLFEGERTAGHLLLLRDISGLARRIQELTSLNELAALFNSTLELDGVLRRVMQRIQAIMQAEAASLLLKEPGEKALRIRVALGEHRAEVEGHHLLAGQGLAGWVFREGVPVIVPDVQSDPRFWSGMDAVTGFTTRAMLCVPLRVRDEVIGVIQVMNRPADNPFSGEDLNLLSAIAAHAAIAIENARLHEQTARHAAELERAVDARTRELQAANANLLKAIRQAEEASRHKAEFLAQMSHELRTPLNFILGFAQLLKQDVAGGLTPKQARFVERIQAGGKQLLDLVSNLLDLSLIEAGRRGLALETIPLAPLLEDIRDLLGVQATQKRLDLAIQTIPPELTVVAERRKLFQILVNLVGNAVKFTPAGGRVAVMARFVPEESQVPGGEPLGGSLQPVSWAPGEEPEDAAAGLPSVEKTGEPGAVEITVNDTGIGIAAEDLERVFRGFEQGDRSSTREYGGAGIGLTLVRTLVALHGGRVWAESAGLGQGARFVVRLPRLRTAPLRRILCVDDEPEVLQLLGRVLREAGYTVEEATTGAAARTALADSPPALLILDIGLPDVDGWTLLREVRGTGRTRSLPVLLLIGPDQGQADRAVALEADEFLTKPVSPTVVLGIVRELMGRVPRHWRDSRGAQDTRA